MKRTWKLGHIDRIALVCCLRCLPHVQYRRLADAFGVDHTAVRAHARKMGFPPRSSGHPLKLPYSEVVIAARLIADGHQLNVLASDLGVHEATLRKALRGLETAKAPR